MKVNVIWSPNHQNRFILHGTDLQLYEVEEIKDGVFSHKPSAVKISSSSVATLLSTNTENQYMKCVSWYPKPQYDHLLAVGQANGRVVLTSFEDGLERTELCGREFGPRHSRQCNCVAWNPVESNLLAAGMDKYRTDYGLLVWDVMKPPHAGSAVDSAAAEIGLSEVTHSLHWFANTPKVIACGVNNKHIKVYDLRDSSKPQNFTATKAVYGICVDPFFEHRLASYFENFVMLWDIRNFEKPVATLHEAKQILKLNFCPTRVNVLAALPKDTSSLKLYEIQQASLGNDEVEPAIVERSIQPFEETAICSFAWHPTMENRMLVVTPEHRIQDYTVFDRITLNWSSRSEIVWTRNKKALYYVDYGDEFFDYLEDISDKMRKRACLGYGIKMEELVLNGEIAGEPQLRTLWTWLSRMKSVDENNKYFPRSGGLYTVLCNENGSTRSVSEMLRVPWTGLKYCGAKVTKYISEERKIVLQMCGWNHETNTHALEVFLECLQKEGDYSRAAATAVFNLDMRRAIQLLNEGAVNRKENSGTDLNAIAMALAGYSEDRNALWRETTSSLKSQLPDPHLRAMFSFVTAEGDNYDAIIDEQEISLQDRIAFACLYLSDRKLGDFLYGLKSQLMKEGNICGIIVTGLSGDGLSLLQNYVDKTGDVQTASAIILHVLPSPIAQDTRAQEWVESYRQLLDYWRLWKQRALFDIEWFKANPSHKPHQQVFVSCNFCGKAVSNYLQMNAPSQCGRFSQLAATTANKSKVTCCPGCRKPLPRCSLCLSHMGTPAGIHWKRPSKPGTVSGKKLTDFSNWLTWCQSCRHGGHSAHILGWFQEHFECTVTGCSCRCMALDGMGKLGTKLNEHS